MASSRIAPTTRGFFHPRSASNFLTRDFSFPRLIDCLPDRRNWRWKSDRCATESSSEPKSCQTGANLAGIRDRGIRETKNGERNNDWKGGRVRGYCNPVLSNWAMLPRTRSVALSKSDQFRGGSWSLLAIRLKAMRFAAVQIAWRSAGASPLRRLAISSTVNPGSRRTPLRYLKQCRVSHHD